MPSLHSKLAQSLRPRITGKQEPIVRFSWKFTEMCIEGSSSFCANFIKFLQEIKILEPKTLKKVAIICARPVGMFAVTSRVSRKRGWLAKTVGSEGNIRDNRGWIDNWCSNIRYFSFNYSIVYVIMPLKW